MRYILLCCSLFVFFDSQAQQINPVPDYVFQNRMSVGRTAVTDTAAYFSIGPRYGAIRGFMPPMVIDTASVTGTKRNGLLIFSIQKNKFLYWDSVGSKWAEMAGTAGSALTGSGAAGYMSEFTTATNLDSTSLYHTAGKFGIGTTSPVRKLHVEDTISARGLILDTLNGLAYDISRPSALSRFIVQGAPAIRGRTTSGGSLASINFYTDGPGDSALLNNNEASQFFYRAKFRNSQSGWQTLDSAIIGKYKVQFGTYTNGLPTARHQFFSKDSNNADQIYLNIDPTSFLISNNLATDVNGRFRVPTSEVHVGSTTDYGAYSLQNTGAFYNTGNAILAASGGDVGIGTTSTNPYTNTGTLITIQNTATNYSFLTLVGGVGSGGAIDFGNATIRHAEIASLSGSNLSFYTNSTNSGTGLSERMRITSAGELLINTTTDAGDYKLQVAGAIYNTTTLTTGAPTSGSAKPWRLGEAATVSPTSPNRTIRVEIDGTVYYIHAKTTND